MQCNYVVKINRQSKEYFLNLKKYFLNLNNTDDPKPFLKTCKPYFSKRHGIGNSKFTLNEKGKILLKHQENVSEFNEYFDQIVDSHELYNYLCENIDGLVDDVDRIIPKFRSYPSIQKTKQNFNVNEKFTFWQVTVNEVEQIIKELPKNKEASGDIPRKVLKQSKFSFKGLRN